MAASNVTNSPVYTRLVDDSSPLLLFDPPSAWNHTAKDGPDLHVNSTYSSSDISGATCQFSFNGTGFSVLGTRKPNYGQYLILLDGEVQQFSNATAQQTEFGQVLGTASGLKDGLHSVVFMVAGGGPVDIDAIVYERLDWGQRHSDSLRPILVKLSDGLLHIFFELSDGLHHILFELSDGLVTILFRFDSPDDLFPILAYSQTASSPAPSIGNRISANPHAQGPNEPAPSQDASVSSASSSQSATPSTSSTVSSATASVNGRLSSESSAQPSDQNTAIASQGAQPTAQPDGQPDAQPGSTQSSTSSAPGPSISQAEEASSPQISGMSASQKSLPTGAIVGISIAVAAALLLIIALLFCLMRRRRRAATARRRMTAGLPSPTLPLQDPSRHASYFFGGHGSNANSGPAGGNGMRELYLAQGPQNPMHVRGRSIPFKTEPEPLRPMTPAVVGDSVHSNADTATLASEDGYITDASSIRTVPTRPPRPPNVRLSLSMV
ncbi:hypothetical protein GSI_08160 [Ganoderma sinense ZZ0214-1]|uniref:Uncharacterized protein n=1 Tax=Ganoderma sinense ZZ0214-1 TaxID=1077348 RepID=A0A2G8S7G3_9APHY|nr:hypothetical protein GSI_08160 [Ganoderma sinense ZZ0214-1]